MVNSASQTELEQALAVHEPDRYVATFFAPGPVRQHLIALYAFDLEIARLAYTIREPMVGQIRLAWWREQVDAIYAGRPVFAPVVVALAPAVMTHKLPRELFDAYIDARAQDLHEQPFDDEKAIRDYACCVHGALFKLAARILGAEHRADGASDLAGNAWNFAVVLREMAHWRKHRRCRLPVSWLSEARLGVEDFFVERSVPILLVDRLKGAVRGALHELNAKRFPRRAMPALAPATCLRWEAGAHFDPLQPSNMPTWQRVARISLSQLLWRV